MRFRPGGVLAMSRMEVVMLGTTGEKLLSDSALYEGPITSNVRSRCVNGLSLT